MYAVKNKRHKGKTSSTPKRKGTQEKNPSLTILIGPVGSGKTFRAIRLNKDRSKTIVNYDTIRKSIRDESVTRTRETAMLESDEAFELLFTRVEDALEKGEEVILDTRRGCLDGSFREGMVLAARNIAKKTGKKIDIIYFLIDRTMEDKLRDCGDRYNRKVPYSLPRVEGKKPMKIELPFLDAQTRIFKERLQRYCDGDGYDDVRVVSFIQGNNGVIPLNVLKERLSALEPGELLEY